MILKIRSGESLVRSIIAYQNARNNNCFFCYFVKKFTSLRYQLLSIITASDISPEASICHDLKLPHPIGIVIHRTARIGFDCMIMQQVTIGQLADGATPTIGDSVYIGAGAKILGGVKIGNNVRIGANAVVLIDVPDGGTAIGIPARVVSNKLSKNPV